MRKILVAGILPFLTVFAAGAVAEPDLKTPAKVLFGRPPLPSDQAPLPIGSYAKGCLAGALPLPIDGPSWQVMRLSRNRHWGMPQLISYVERFSADVAEKDASPGLLIGDMAQPRGGPMASGHASHQTGLDVDIWFVPMPTRVLAAGEREAMSAVSLLMPGRLAIDPAKWSSLYARILKRAVSYPEVGRIFVSAAIKQQLCDTAGGDRDWLRKIRPWSGHEDHFHVRLDCPPGIASCVGQPPPPPGDGCGADLAAWFKPKPPPQQPVKPVKPKPPLTLSGLPDACTGVLYGKDAPAKADAATDAIGKVIGPDAGGATVGN
jgi:penicillin-insensitive murein endopeptidase